MSSLADDSDTIWLAGWEELEDGDVVDLRCTYDDDPAGDRVVGVPSPASG